MVTARTFAVARQEAVDKPLKGKLVFIALELTPYVAVLGPATVNADRLLPPTTLVTLETFSRPFLPPGKGVTSTLIPLPPPKLAVIPYNVLLDEMHVSLLPAVHSPLLKETTEESPTPLGSFATDIRA